MSAPVLWIFLPLLIAGLLLLINNQKVVLLIACLFILFLTLAAWLLPIDVALKIGGWTIKLVPSFEILGRNLTITSADRSFLALVYGSTFFWFIPVASLQIETRTIPLGLTITSMLIAAIAVEPFLYAALIIEVAVLLSIPMLSIPQHKPSKGIIRFLIFQTLAVPFILFSGWLFSGIGANPGNLTLVQLAAIFLGLGFAFMLAIFPFYSWIPMLAEEVHPYVLGFLLWVLPTATMFFGLGFLDRFTWLRESLNLTDILTIIGALMVVFGGLLSAFQQQLVRMMGFAIIMQTGLSLLALSLLNQSGLGIFLLLLVPRTLSLNIWSLSLSILRKQAPELTLKAVKGTARTWPFATSGLILANLALAGLPLLAGFPAVQAVWEALAHNSLPLALGVLVGSLGLLISAIRILVSITDISEGTTWRTLETPTQRLFMTVGLLTLFLLGLFPQWAFFLWTKLPVIFEHFVQ
jgi:NADH-quinone oxidoreductase subunit N